MTSNGNYSQNIVNLEIPVHFGGDRKVRTYGCLLLEAALDKEGIMYYIKPNKPNGNNSVVLVCKEPYKENEIVKIVKEAMLKDIDSKNPKKSPLRSSWEEYCFYPSEND